MAIRERSNPHLGFLARCTDFFAVDVQAIHLAAYQWLIFDFNGRLRLGTLDGPFISGDRSWLVGWVPFQWDGPPMVLRLPSEAEFSCPVEVMRISTDLDLALGEFSRSLFGLKYARADAFGVQITISE